MGADNWGICPQCGKSETLREDYEIGIVNGEFEVIYGGKCYYGRNIGCGFEFHYRCRERMQASPKSSVSEESKP